MNGFSTGEEDSRGPTDQICCLFDNGDRCTKPAGNASYSKRIQKTVTQRRLNLGIDNSVSTYYFDLIILVQELLFSHLVITLLLFSENSDFHSLICCLCNGGNFTSYFVNWAYNLVIMTFNGWLSFIYLLSGEDLFHEN